MFAELDPALVVLDIQMPIMNGPDACAAIRATSEVPIIMFTSTDDATSVKDAILKGATDFVLKTTGVSELTDRIAYHLEKIERGKISISASEPQIEVPETVTTFAATPAAPIVSTTLIVDPDQASRDAIKAVLHRLNQNTIEAVNATEAIDAFKKHNPDIVISEWSLPEMDAYNLLKKLTRGSNARKVIKLLMATRVSPEAHRKLQYVGVSDFLYKPLNGAKVEILVADCVRKAIRGKRGKRRKTA